MSKFNSKKKGNSKNTDDEEVRTIKGKGSNRAKRQKGNNGKGTTKTHTDSNNSWNDWRWYVPDEQILRDVASYPFSDRLGIPVDFRPLNGMTTDWYDDSPISTPGIAAIKTYPYVGTVTAAGDAPVNIAGRMLYQEIRKANSGSTNYDWNDLMMYYLVMDNCYMLWSYLRRMYGVARAYQYRNSYYPGTVLNAMGISNSNAVLGALPQLRYLINNLALKLSSYPVPAVMPYFIRHQWMYDNIYVDGLTSKSQSYMFVPECLYAYDTTTVPARLSRVPISITATNPNVFINNLNTLVDTFTDPLSDNSEISVIGGDVLKAYGPTSCFNIPMTSEDYVTTVVYSEEVLRQIHNLTINNITDFSTHTTAICQDPVSNNIYQDFSVTQFDRPVKEWIINLDLDSVTPQDMIVSTRLTGLMNVDESDFVGGDMLVDKIVVYNVNETFSGSGIPRITTYSSNCIYTGNGSSISGFSTLMRRMTDASNFRYFPLLYWEHASANTSTSPDDRGVICDLNNYTVIDPLELQRMHQAAFMGLFAIPYGIYSSRSVNIPG